MTSDVHPKTQVPPPPPPPPLLRQDFRALCNTLVNQLVQQHMREMPRLQEARCHPSLLRFFLDLGILLRKQSIAMEYGEASHSLHPKP